MGSFMSSGSGQKIREWGAGVTGPAKIIWRNPVRVKAGIGEGGQSDLGDRWIAVARRERVDDALFSLIASLAITVKGGIGEIRDNFCKGVRNEDGVIRYVAGAFIRYRHRPRPAANRYGPIRDRVEWIARNYDRHGAFGKVRHIEQ